MVEISPLRLEAYRLSDLVIAFNDEWFLGESTKADPADAYEVDADFDLYEMEDAGSYLHSLSVECIPRAGDVPRRFNRVSIVLWGSFSFDPDADQDLRDQLIPHNCIAILHGIARGLVSSATGSCAGGPFLLPIVNYMEMIERNSQEQSDEAAHQVPREEPTTE